jgi:hypothetical protein
MESSSEDRQTDRQTDRQSADNSVFFKNLKYAKNGFYFSDKRSIEEKFLVQMYCKVLGNIWMCLIQIASTNTTT